MVATTSTDHYVHDGEDAPSDSLTRRHARCAHGLSRVQMAVCEARGFRDDKANRVYTYTSGGHTTNIRGGRKPTLPEQQEWLRLSIELSDVERAAVMNVLKADQLLAAGPENRANDKDWARDEHRAFREPKWVAQEQFIKFAQRAGLSSAARFVMTRLLYHMDRSTLSTWVGIPTTLTPETGLCTKTVQRALRELESTHVILTVPYGHGRSNLYVLNPDVEEWQYPTADTESTVPKEVTQTAVVNTEGAGFPGTDDYGHTGTTVDSESTTVDCATSYHDVYQKEEYLRAQVRDGSPNLQSEGDEDDEVPAVRVGSKWVPA